MEENKTKNIKKEKIPLNKKHKRKIKIAFMRVALLAMLLMLSTYAWFTSQKDITLSNIRGTVEVVENMEISLDAKTWYQKIDLSNAVNVFNTAQLSRDEALGETGNVAKTTALAVLPEQLFPVSGVGKTGATLLPLYTGEATSTSLSEITQCTENPMDGYIAFDIYIKNTSRDNEADVLQLNVNSSAQVLTETINKQITDVTGNRVDRTYNGNDASGLQNTIRVALAKYGDEVSSTATQVEILEATKGASIEDIAIWEPNAYDHVESIVSNNNKLINSSNTEKIEFTTYHPNMPLETYALNENAIGRTIENVYNIASTGLGAQSTFKTDNIKEGTEIQSYRIKTTNEKPIDIKNTSGNDFEISSNVVTRYRVYVWLEGQDVDCINIASLGGGIELDLGLTKDDETGDVLNEIDERVSYSTLEQTSEPVVATITMEEEITPLPVGWTYVDASTKVAIKKEYENNQIEQVKVSTVSGKISTVEVIISNIGSDFLKTVSLNPQDNYGRYINYPIDIDGNSSDNDWQIFYSDGENVFIKADTAIQTPTFEGEPDLEEIFNYPIYNDNKYMISKIDMFNRQSANYMLTTVLFYEPIWQFYANEYAESAIGGPTIEMWVASWNKKGYIELETENDNIGYYIGKAGNNLTEIADQENYLEGGYVYILPEGVEGNNDTMYFGLANQPFHIASPSAYAESAIFAAVKSSGVGNGVTGIGYTIPEEGNGIGYSPIVCLKTDLEATLNGDVWEINAE